MATLIRPRAWRTQPPVGSQINWGHPLARGLVACFIFNGAGTNGHNLVNGKRATSASTNVMTHRHVGRSSTHGHSYGLSFYDTGGNTFGYLDPGITLPAQTTTTKFTQRAIYYDPNAGGDGEPIIGNRSGGGPNTTFQKLANDAWAYYDNGLQGPTLTPVYNTWIDAVCVKAGAPLNAYQNGVLMGTGTATSNQNAQPWYIGGDSSAGECGEVHIAHAALWVDRAFTRAEVEWLNAEPYAFINPPAPKILYFPLGGGGGGDTPVTDADTGSGVDADESIAAAVSGADTATGTDGDESIAVALTTTETATAADAEGSIGITGEGDTGSGTDAGEALAGATTDGDTGGGIDAESIAVALSDADTGSGADAGESLAVALTDADSGSGVDAGESLTVAIADSDTASAVDAGTVGDTPISDGDDGSGTDAGESIVVYVSDTDSASAADTETLAAVLGDLDTGAALDLEYELLCAVADAESAIAADVGSVFTGELHDIDYTTGRTTTGWRSGPVETGWSTGRTATAWRTGALEH